MDKVTHKEDCKRVFKKYDMSCARCIELSNGSKPREGWFAPRAQAEARRSLAIKNHNCQRSGCMSVCVAFDW